MKRYLLAIVNAITELTEVFRFGMEDIMERFEDVDTSLYIMATTKEATADELAEEYQWGFDDGYELARSIFEPIEDRSAPVSTPLSGWYEYEDDEAEDFIWDKLSYL